MEVRTDWGEGPGRAWRCEISSHFNTVTAWHWTKHKMFLRPASGWQKWVGDPTGAQQSDLTTFLMSSMKAFLAETQKFFP